jgi:hypothetical protein
MLTEQYFLVKGIRGISFVFWKKSLVYDKTVTRW